MNGAPWRRHYWLLGPANCPTCKAAVLFWFSILGWKERDGRTHRCK